jgi:ABC-type proline/glycine betaine transport system permease subunit
MKSTTEPSANRLDFRAILEVPLRQFVLWLAMVVLVSFAGYPGVVCVTPMAWLIALRVGNLCVARSRSEKSSQRLLEAALAGGFLGLLQGILFLVVIPFSGPIQPDEQTQTIFLTLLMIVVGIFAGAGLSFFTAFLHERKAA